MGIPSGYVSGQVVQAVVGVGKVLQVLSTTLSSSFTSSSTTFTDITGLTVSITPTLATSKILVVASLTGSNNVGVAACQVRLAKDGTGVFVGDAAGSRTPSDWMEAISGSSMVTLGLSFLDSPASTSALTYSVQGRNTSAGTFFVNRTSTDSDTSGFPRAASSITVMEISV
jgi:hypothetical protein